MKISTHLPHLHYSIFIFSNQMDEPKEDNQTQTKNLIQNLCQNVNKKAIRRSPMEKFLKILSHSAI